MKPDKTLILEFEAVYQNATVFLNGRQVAEHPYGYTNFFVDITGKVIAGTNELKVVADNADVPEQPLVLRIRYLPRSAPLPFRKFLYPPGRVKSADC